MNFEPETESSELKNAEKAPDCEIKLSQWEGLFDWPIVFGNPNPLEIEIGCGRGMFIIKSARENPGMNYLGIEMSARFFRMLKERVQKSAAQEYQDHTRRGWFYFKEVCAGKFSRSSSHLFPGPLA